MAIRAGMAILVDKLRDLTGVLTSEYTDDELQTVLDENKYAFNNINLTPTPYYTSGNVLIYRNLYIPSNVGQWFEVPVNNVVNSYFYLYDYQHSIIFFGTGDEKATYDPYLKRIVLNSTPIKKLFYLDIYSYDLYGCAAIIWQKKLTDRVSYIDIRTDNHTLNLDQEYQHCKDRYLYFYGKSMLARNFKLIRVDQGVGADNIKGYHSGYAPAELPYEY